MEKVQCPANKSWLKGMLRVLPVELAQKLQPYTQCLTEEEKKELGLAGEEKQVEHERTDE